MTQNSQHSRRRYVLHLQTFKEKVNIITIPYIFVLFWFLKDDQDMGDKEEQSAKGAAVKNKNVAQTPDRDPETAKVRTQILDKHVNTPIFIFWFHCQLFIDHRQQQS